MAKTTYHVIPNLNKGWSIKRSGATRAVKHFKTKEAAVEYARDLSLNQEAELFMHRTDGTIMERNSYDQDPQPAEG
jgi:hypothetical protein